MFGKKRLGVVIMICIAMVLSLTNPIMAIDQADTGSAAESNISVMPMMVYINSISTAMYIEGYGVTTAAGRISAYSSTTDEVWIFLYLERYVNGSWVTYASWSEIFNTYHGYLEGTKVVPHGYYYRVRGSYYAWSGSNYEHVTGYSSVQYY
ncbi:MAG TPA: hypothetical protein DD640_10900 [Clostridiales bacterium]|nr:hypothetical protein [Clostridiales bacterium]